MNEFEIKHDRHNTSSLKWDTLDSSVLPMWVADMDFQAPKEVNEAIIERAKHGIYGYTYVNDNVQNAIINWLYKRHQWKIQADWLEYSPGVVTTLHLAIQSLTEKNDKVLIQTPVYTPFYDVVEQHGRVIVENPLIEENGYYKIDFVDLEKKMQAGIKAFILCSPHNPVGRVWTKVELEKIVTLCLKYKVLILSDEIHCDLILPDHTHIPIASLSEEAANQTVTMMSASKTFNLAGLQASYLICKNEKLRDKITHQLEIQGLNALNTMGITALEAAYTYGEPWLEKLNQIILRNKNYVKDMFTKHAKELSVIDSEATYLLWIDCRKLCMEPEQLEQFFVETAKVGLNAGRNYGTQGDQYMRMNIACHEETLEEAVKRIIQAINNR